MKNETELRELFEKTNPVPEGVFWTVSEEYGTTKMDAQSCVIYDAKWQGFKQATEYYEQQLAEKDKEIARLNELVYQLQTDIIGITE